MDLETEEEDIQRLPPSPANFSAGYQQFQPTGYAPTLSGNAYGLGGLDIPTRGLGLGEGTPGTNPRGFPGAQLPTGPGGLPLRSATVGPAGNRMRYGGPGGSPQSPTDSQGVFGQTPNNPDPQKMKQVKDLEGAIDQIGGMDNLSYGQKKALVDQKVAELQRIDPNHQYRKTSIGSAMTKAQKYVAENVHVDPDNGVMLALKANGDPVVHTLPEKPEAKDAREQQKHLFQLELDRQKAEREKEKHASDEKIKKEAADHDLYNKSSVALRKKTVKDGVTTEEDADPETVKNHVRNVRRGMAEIKAEEQDRERLGEQFGKSFHRVWQDEDNPNRESDQAHWEAFRAATERGHFKAAQAIKRLSQISSHPDVPLDEGEKAEREELLKVARPWFTSGKKKAPSLPPKDFAPPTGFSPGTQSAQRSESGPEPVARPGYLGAAND